VNEGLRTNEKTLDIKNWKDQRQEFHEEVP
jgi:hypothetical protein